MKWVFEIAGNSKDVITVVSYGSSFSFWITGIYCLVFGLPEYLIFISFFAMPFILIGIFYLPERSAIRALKNHNSANMLIAFILELSGLIFMLLVLYLRQNG